MADKPSSNQDTRGQHVRSGPASRSLWYAYQDRAQRPELYKTREDAVKACKQLILRFQLQARSTRYFGDHYGPVQAITADVLYSKLRQFDEVPKGQKWSQSKCTVESTEHHWANVWTELAQLERDSTYWTEREGLQAYTFDSVDETQTQKLDPESAPRAIPTSSPSVTNDSSNSSYVSAPEIPASNDDQKSRKRTADEAGLLVHTSRHNEGKPSQVHLLLRIARTPTPEPRLPKALPCPETTTAPFTTDMEHVNHHPRSRLDFGKVRNAMNELVSDVASSMKHLFEELIWSLNETIEIDHAPNESFHALLVMTFGSDYKTSCNKLRAAGLWTTLKAIQATLWAFLYKEVFASSSQWQLFVCKRAALLNDDCTSSYCQRFTQVLTLSCSYGTCPLLSPSNR